VLVFQHVVSLLDRYNPNQLHQSKFKHVSEADGTNLYTLQWGFIKDPVTRSPFENESSWATPAYRMNKNNILVRSAVF